MYARTYSKDSINFLISAWKMSGEPAIPIGNLLYEYLPQGKMIVQILDASGSNLMIVAHVKIKGCCKSETFKLLQYHAYFRDWKGFSN